MAPSLPPSLPPSFQFYISFNYAHTQIYVWRYLPVSHRADSLHCKSALSKVAVPSPQLTWKALQVTGPRLLIKMCFVFAILETSAGFHGMSGTLAPFIHVVQSLEIHKRAHIWQSQHRSKDKMCYCICCFLKKIFTSQHFKWENKSMHMCESLCLFTCNKYNLISYGRKDLLWCFHGNEYLCW